MHNYRLSDRLLHRAALQVRAVAEMSFDIDQRTSSFDKNMARDGRHVFVSGLARAGTTILLRRIYASGSFCSLTYRNMPFVLAPHIWGRRGAMAGGMSAPVERAHGDRILIDIDSPESLDEVFWRVFEGDRYIARTHLRPHDPDDDVMNSYAAYVAAILHADAKGRTRYLSKNNNNILRLGSIGRTFPQATILVPFRHPLAHASSLLRQHRNFSSQQQADPFVRSYMTWLVHHEFGLDHRPFKFDGSNSRPPSMDELEQVDYWLNLWLQTYAFLEKSAPKNAIFVCYEDLCENPLVWSRLAAICGIEARGAEDEPFVLGAASIDKAANAELTNLSLALYGRLAERARAALP